MIIIIIIIIIIHIITDEVSDFPDISPTGHVPFGRNDDSEVSLQENDFQDISKPQERIRGSLIFRDISSNKPRPPPTGVNNGNFQLCKW